MCCVLSCFSCVQLFVTPWTVPPPPQAPLSMEFSRQEHWSGLSFPPLGDLPNPGIEPMSPTLQADYFPAEPQGKPKNNGVGTLSLLQRIFPTQDLNLGSPALQADSLPTELSGKPCPLLKASAHCHYWRTPRLRRNAARPVSPGIWGCFNYSSGTWSQE